MKWEIDNRSIRQENGITIVCIVNKEDAETLSWMREYFDHAVFVLQGTKYVKQEERLYEIGNQEDDYKTVINELSRYQSLRIIHALSLKYQFNSVESDELSERQYTVLLNLFYLAKAVMEIRIAEGTELVVLSKDTAIVTGRERSVNPENTALCKAVKVVTQEFEEIRSRYIDFDQKTSYEKIAQEIRNKDAVTDCAYRDNLRYVAKAEAINLRRQPKKPVMIQENGIYVITGGNGGLARVIVPYFTSQGGKVVLLGRRKEHNGQIPECCTYIQCDITNGAQLQETLQFIRKNEGMIRGIVHCAGVVDDKPIFLKKEEEVIRVLSPKVQGTWLIGQLTREDTLDFLLLFSSVSSIAASAGQFDYAAANGYLDGFSEMRNLQGRRTLAINWAAWRETGMAYRLGIQEEKNTYTSLTTEDAYHAFEEVLRYDLQNVIVGEVKAKDKNVARLPLDGVTSSEDSVFEFTLNGAEDSLSLSETEIRVAKVWYEVLGNKNISIDDNFDSLGGDSILAVRLLTHLNKFYHELDITMVYSYPTIRQMAEYIDRINKKNEEKAEVIEEQKDDIDKLLDQLEKREVQVSDVIGKLK